MSFLSPLAFAFALLAVPIVVFYILKITLRRVPVTTTMFWRQIFEEKQARSLWQNLRHLISLLVNLLLLFLLVLALTQPYFSWEVMAARKFVLVLDNSASMQATDVSPTRFEAAKSTARTLIRGMRFHDEMAVVSAGGEPAVVCGLTGHERTLLSRVDAVTVTDGPTGVPAAVALARQLVGSGDNVRILVVSDGGFDSAPALVNEPGVEVHPVGTAANNVGITRFQVRRSLIDPIGFQVLVEVANHADTPVEGRLDLDLNENPVDVKPLRLEPGAVWSDTLDGTATVGGVLTAKLNMVDSFAVDNTAYAVLPQREPLNVVLVTQGNWFLQKVLEANPIVNLQTVKSLPATLPPRPVIILHKQCPETLPAGPVFVIAPESNTDAWTVGEPLANPIVVKQDSESLVLTHVKLDNVLFPEARELTLAEGGQVLLGGLNNEPLLASFDRVNGKALVLTVDLDQGDLPLRTAFPILMTNALGWFSGNTGELRESAATGTLVELDLPAGKPLDLVSPAGTRRPLPTASGRTPVGPLDAVGVWSVEPRRMSAEASKGIPARGEPEATAPVLRLGCNLANRRESDLRIPESWAQLAATKPAASSWFTRPTWFYLLVLAWLVSTAEWFLYQRRWIT
jgi:hypothetical protein